MRKLMAAVVLCLDGAAEQRDRFETDVDDAMEKNLTSVSR